MCGPPDSHTTAELAERVGGELRGRPDLAITGIGSLDEATSRDITLIGDVAHARRWGASHAAAALISAGLEPHDHDGKSRALIEVPDATVAVIDLLNLFAPAAALPDPGIHPCAFVDPTATVGRDPRIGPHVSIGARASVGDRVTLHAGARIYPGVEIGDDTIVHANTVIRERCRIGRRVVLFANVSIGSDGFGFEPAPGGSGLVKVPQIGTVVIEDDVEVGAGSCIDRAKFGTTSIGACTKIDNLVQIAHNCRIGPGCVIAALTGISGSCTLGRGVRIAGAVGIADHVTIGDGASIGAGSGVMRDIPAGGARLGSPATEARRALREWAAIRKLPDLMHRLSRLVKADKGKADFR